MTLVTSDDMPRTRIGPKVFADVPSAAELQTARKTRNALAIWVVLFAGMAIAFAAFAYLLYSTAGATEDTLIEERDTAIERLAEKEQEAVALQARLGELNKYERVEALQSQAAALRSEIETMMRVPVRADARNRISARDWRVYTDPAPAWGSEVERSLEQHVTALVALRDRVDALGPRAPARDPRTDPRNDPRLASPAPQQ